MTTPDYRSMPTFTPSSVSFTGMLDGAFSSVELMADGSAEAVRAAAETVRTLMTDEAKRLAKELNRIGTLMLCDGRARKGWVIHVIWGEAKDGLGYRVVEAAPNAPVEVYADPSRIRIDTVRPGDMLEPANG